MKQTVPALCLILALSACGKSSSSSSPTPAPTPAPSSGADAGGVTDTSGTPASNGSTTTGEKAEPLALDTVSSITYNRLQYDCGNVKAPLNAADVTPALGSIADFTSLTAAMPKRDQAMIVLKTKNTVSCDYRAIFGVNKEFTQITFTEAQALTPDSFTACGAEQASLDAAFSASIVPFDYEPGFYRWIAVHIPTALQTTQVCATGALRVVFAASLN